MYPKYALLALAALAPSVAAQEASGKLGTLPHGTYQCSLPGDAAGAAWVDLPDKMFVIGNASTYRTVDGPGTYLLTGDKVIFTSGPMNGMRFDRVSEQTLRWVDQNGEASRVRCTRRAGSL